MEGETVAWEIAVSDPAETSRRMRISQGDDSSERKDFVLSATNGVTIRDGYAYIPQGVTSFKLKVTAVVDGWGADRFERFTPGKNFAEGTEKLVLKLSAKAEEAKTLSVTIKESERRTVRLILKSMVPGVYGNQWVFQHMNDSKWWHELKKINVLKHVGEDEIDDFFGPLGRRIVKKDQTLGEYSFKLKEIAERRYEQYQTDIIFIGDKMNDVYSRYLSTNTVVGVSGSSSGMVSATEYLRDVYKLLKTTSLDIVGYEEVLKNADKSVTDTSVMGRLSKTLKILSKADLPINTYDQLRDAALSFQDSMSDAIAEIKRDMNSFMAQHKAAKKSESVQAMAALISQIIGGMGMIMASGSASFGAGFLSAGLKKAKSKRGDADLPASSEFFEIASKNADEMIALGDYGLTAVEFISSYILNQHSAGGFSYKWRSQRNNSSSRIAGIAEQIDDDELSASYDVMMKEFDEFLQGFGQFSEYVLTNTDREGMSVSNFRRGTKPDGQEYNKLYGSSAGFYFWEATTIGQRGHVDQKWEIPTSWFQLAPVVLDLDGDGFAFTPLAASAASYDANGDGDRERIAWVGKRDGILSYDKNDDGLISATDEISFVGYREGAKTDLEGLVAFDTNANGKLDAGDAQWGRFKVWTDTNGDGISDHGELVSLDEAGIASISLVSDKIQYEENDVTVFGIAEVERVDGTKINAADAAFAYKPNALDARLLQLKAAIAGMAPAGQGPGSVTQEAYQRTLVGAIAAA
jgi:hypothetical protein